MTHCGSGGSGVHGVHGVHGVVVGDSAGMLSVWTTRGAANAAGKHWTHPTEGAAYGGGGHEGAQEGTAVDVEVYGELAGGSAAGFRPDGRVIALAVLGARIGEEGGGVPAILAGYEDSTMRMQELSIGARDAPHTARAHPDGGRGIVRGGEGEEGEEGVFREVGGGKAKLIECPENGDSNGSPWALAVCGDVLFAGLASGKIQVWHGGALLE